MADLKEALKGDDADAIQAKTNTLAQASMKLGEAMYKQQQERPATAARARAGAAAPAARRKTWSTRNSPKSTTTRRTRSPPDRSESTRHGHCHCNARSRCTSAGPDLFDGFECRLNADGAEMRSAMTNEGEECR